MGMSADDVTAAVTTCMVVNLWCHQTVIYTVRYYWSEKNHEGDISARHFQLFREPGYLKLEIECLGTRNLFL